MLVIISKKEAVENAENNENLKTIIGASEDGENPKTNLV